ncbi:MAG: Hsp20/alpha crystallin family protein [Candidatus Eisenbacteria bacterium]
MKLIRWNPAYHTPGLDPFQGEVDRLFHSVLAPTQGSSPALLTPAVDIEESKEAFVFRADLPGLKSEDVTVSLEADTLTLRGERKHSAQLSEGSMRRLERAFGAFERRFTFDTPVQGDAVSALYRDGVLEVTVPKAEVAKARDIQIQVG